MYSDFRRKVTKSIEVKKNTSIKEHLRINIIIIDKITKKNTIKVLETVKTKITD